ncbi:MAG TPA: hypothetical protein PLZ43_13460 [bacterium]|nr:hypothetical protein [bacterium]
MENWQLTLVILAAVFTGAMIPMLFMMTRAFYRAGREISQTGERLVKLLDQVEIITGRVEVITRGFKDGETDIADLLKSAGNLSRGIERNIKIINFLSTFLTSAGSAAIAFFQHKIQSEKEPETTK